MDILFTIFSFILLISIIVGIHELAPAEDVPSEAVVAGVFTVALPCVIHAVRVVHRALEQGPPRGPRAAGRSEHARCGIRLGQPGRLGA